MFLLPRRLGILTTSNYILEIILKILIAVSLLLLYTHKIRLDYLYSERLYIESEKKLIDSEEKFKVIVENAPDIIFIVDSNYRIQFINKTPDGIDPSPSDTLGKSCLDYVPKSYHSVVKKSINYVFKEHKPTSYETKARGQAGSIIWYSTRLAPIGHGKSVHSVLLITRDMTKQKNIEKQLRIMNTLKSELINRTSHELKTPLVSIKGFSELLLKKYKEDLDSDILSLIKEIKKGSRRLEKLVKDLFKTSKLEYGNLKLHKKKSNISELIREVLMQLREKIESRNHQIETNLESNLICEFDRENIKEVLINLINNAINYTPPNGKITIDSNLNGQNVIIKIIDTGIGIDNEDNANLFRYFGKVEHFGKGLDVITEGPGLGLYISKNIVQLHGGKLWFESKGKFKGTTFYFTLPC